MESKEETEAAIFKQICKVNELDPQVIRKEVNGNTIDALIRTAFHQRANTLVADLDTNVSMTEGKEYNADGDPAAPSFTINEEYICETYSKDNADKIIAALGQVQLPIQG
ncbi:hypothetical protein [Pontibacter pamirensis]|uniref:hypothetical protein n=1 Tax=Pontibacter pamirensis TaxID=2562824 RepID=UPI001389EE79|nr:hypothetical protein [Pontibacter pamirensis]